MFAASIPSPPLGQFSYHTSEAQELERLSILGIAAMNQRDWDYTSREGREFLGHIDENCCVRFDSHPQGISWLEANRTLRAVIEQSSDYHIDITHLSSDIRAQEGRATVHVQSAVTGVAEVKLVIFTEMLWKRHRYNGKWVCYESVTMSGDPMQMAF